MTLALVALSIAAPAVLAQPGRLQPDALEPPGPPEAFAMPEDDPAGPAARALAAWAQERRRRRRGLVPHAAWQLSPGSRWSVRPEADCLAELDALGVGYHRMTWTPNDRLPSPVTVDDLFIEDVHFRKTVPLPLVISCELAARLPELAIRLRAHGVKEVEVVSAYRATPRSFHSVGMALDLKSFVTRDAVLRVEDHFQPTPTLRTCEAPPPADARARALLEIACDLAGSRRWSTVLTPNYNEGHRDHFHLDIRPDDPRLYVR